jgi:large subunit ribosomal protein L7Ae
MSTKAVKKTPAAGGAAKAEPKKRIGAALIEKRPRSYKVGQHIQPSRDVTRFVRWPRYVRIQRQRRILYKRLKVPPTINLFTRTVDKALATSLFKLLHKYTPETDAQKKARLLALAQTRAGEKKAFEAAKKAAGGDAKKASAAVPKPAAKPLPPAVLKFGLNHVTALVEQKKAKLVLIAHDVDPIELVVWLPLLCAKMDVPYCIVKGKARLGQLVHQKTATAVAITTVKKEDTQEFAQILTALRPNYNDLPGKVRNQWGGGLLGPKALARKAAKERAHVKEETARASGTV